METLLRVHIVDIYYDEKSPNTQKIRKLTYEYVTVGGKKRVSRSEGIYAIESKWWGTAPKIDKVLIPEGLLPESISVIPVYWFKNIDWQGQQFGSSELRGFEQLLRGVGQATTDQQAALSLEGLGVYATDGGRPVNDAGQDSDWEISPGKVMEVPSGSYFRRVEGLSSLKPSMDHINYLESKLREATALSDVALGRIDVQTAQSGIALAIKFLPTLAKIEERDQAGIDKLTQMFFDWKNWMIAYENSFISEDIDITIGAKLPADRTATVNELNNMMDRKVISAQYYRSEMTKLGYTFPDDIQEQIEEEMLAQVAISTPPELQQNAVDAAAGSKPPPANTPGVQQGSRSNNARSGKVNESKGTESGQSARRQARGGKP